MFRYIVASAAVMTLAVGASAQTQQMSAGNLHATVAPTTGVYNMTTGFEVATPSYRSGPATIFDNTGSLTYYFSYVGATQEWVDTMAFAATEISGEEQINGFDYSYCSGVADPAGTQDVVTTEVRFYAESIQGAEPTGWTDLGAGTIQNADCAYAIAVPGGDATGALQCWNIAIDLACGFECSLPQEITAGGFTEFNGIGWMYLDAGSSGLSGPFLGSKAGVGGAPFTTGYGSKDLFELMDLAVVGAEHQGTFWFGGSTKATATFNVVMYGNGIANTDAVNADAPLAGDVLCFEVDTAVVTGANPTWSLVDQGVAFANPAYAMLVSSGSGSLAVNGLATVLIDPSRLLNSPIAMNGAVPAFTFAGGAGLPGLPPSIYTQALGFSAGVSPANTIEASNALRHNN